MRWRASFVESIVGDEAEVRRVAAREGLSIPFEVAVDFLLDDPDFDTNAALSSGCGVMLADEDATDDASRRFFHGVVAEAEYTGEVDRRHAYRFVLRPWTHELELRQASRVFHDVSALEAADAVLRAVGGGARWETRGSYERREQRVQYMERDWDFVARLLEDEGVFYWFEHTFEGHTLCCGDDASSFREMDGASTLSFTTSLQADRESVSDLTRTARVTLSSFALRGWNWRDPRKPVTGEATGEGLGGLLWVEHPGGASDDPTAAGRAARRCAEVAARRREVKGRCNCVRLRPGVCFAVEGAVPTSCDGELLALEVEHLFEEAPRAEGDLGRARYECTFVAIPAAVEFRPPRETPRPTLPARELATVVSASGDEVDVDAHGRVHVRFHWGRGAGPTDGRSARLRVQQLNLGGSLTTPRDGWEVEVAFLDGDPDEAIVLQRLHRAEAPPPEALPDDRGRSVFGGRTVPGASGANTLRFDDTRDAMEVLLHAARDLEVTAGHDLDEHVVGSSTTLVTGASHEDVGGREAVTVEGDQALRVEGSAREKVGGDRHVTVRADDGRHVVADATVAVTGDRRETLQGDREVYDQRTVQTYERGLSRTIDGAAIGYAGEAWIEVVGGDRREETADQRVEVIEARSREATDGDVSIEAGPIREVVGGDLLQRVTGTMSIQVSGKVDDRALGDVRIEGRTVSIEAAQGVALKVGDVSLEGRDGAWTGRAPSVGIAGRATLDIKGPLDLVPPEGVSAAAPDQERPEGTTWVEVELVDPLGNPVPRKRYRVELADGSVREGVLDELGFAREDGVADGTAKITFPDLDREAWKKV